MKSFAALAHPSWENPMPVEYLILPDLDVTYVKYLGHVSAPQIALAFDVHQSDDDFRPGRNEFADLSSVVIFDMDFASVASHFERIVKSYRDNGAPTFTAIFAPRPEQSPLAYAFAKMTEGTEILDAKVYVEPESALNALGLAISPGEFFLMVDDDQQ